MSRWIVMAGVAAVITAAVRLPPAEDRWSHEEREILTSLALSVLGEMPADPTNRYADDPRAAALGHRLFFDERLSVNGKVSCATCHDPAREFQDGTPLAQGVGTTDRRTMPVASTAWSHWMFWDGRKDSQWSQALGPLESPVEHGGTRSRYAHVVAEHYRVDYEALFGPLPDLSRVPTDAGPVDDPAARAAWEVMSAGQRDQVTDIFVKLGKAIAAYERRIQYGPGRVDRYLEEVAATGRAPAGVLTADEAAGLRLFIGKADCVSCHNGPLFSDQHFHNTGVPVAAVFPNDRGRESGALAVLTDEFNCRSRHSDAPDACDELEFLVVDDAEQVRAFKTPSLRNVALRPPYMHAGQLATLEDVVRHYDLASAAPVGRSELKPLGLSARERRQLVAFLRALSAPLATPPELLAPPVR